MESVRRVQVEWWDHCEAATGTWCTLEEARAAAPSRVTSVGWLVGEDELALRLCSSTVDGEDTWSRPLVLLRAAVVSVVDLPAPTRKRRGSDARPTPR